MMPNRSCGLTLDKPGIPRWRVVLQWRIELQTSPLPRAFPLFDSTTLFVLVHGFYTLLRGQQVGAGHFFRHHDMLITGG